LSRREARRHSRSTFQRRSSTVDEHVAGLRSASMQAASQLGPRTRIAGRSTASIKHEWRRTVWRWRAGVRGRRGGAVSRRSGQLEDQGYRLACVLADVVEGVTDVFLELKKSCAVGGALFTLETSPPSRCRHPAGLERFPLDRDIADRARDVRVRDTRWPFSPANPPKRSISFVGSRAEHLSGSRVSGYFWDGAAEGRGRANRRGTMLFERRSGHRSQSATITWPPRHPAWAQFALGSIEAGLRPRGPHAFAVLHRS